MRSCGHSLVGGRNSARVCSEWPNPVRTLASRGQSRVAGATFGHLGEKVRPKRLMNPAHGNWLESVFFAPTRVHSKPSGRAPNARLSSEGRARARPQSRKRRVSSDCEKWTKLGEKARKMLRKCLKNG